MDKKKAKIAETKTPAQILHEKLAKCGSTAKYELIYDWTLTTTNVPKYTWKVTVQGQEAFGTDNNKKKAKQEAARAMLTQIIDDIELLKALPQNTGENMQNHIGHLSMFCSRNALPQPHYYEDLEDGPAHKRRFYWNCTVGKYKEVGIAHSTKAAKQLAAQAMYLKLMNVINNPNDVHLLDYRLNTENMPLCKIEKSEKLEPSDVEGVEDAENEYGNRMSPEPSDFEEMHDDLDRASEMRYQNERRESPRRGDRRYENEDYDRIDYHSTADYSRSESSRNPQRSKNITVTSEECLEKKYKIQLSSFTDWSIPLRSELRSCDDNEQAVAGSSTSQDHHNVKKEMKYSQSINASRIDEKSSMDQGTDEMNHSVQDPVSPTPAPPNDYETGENIYETDDFNIEPRSMGTESEIDITEHKIQPEVEFKIKLEGFTTSAVSPVVSNAASDHESSALRELKDIPDSPDRKDSRTQEKLSTVAADIGPVKSGDTPDSIDLQTAKDRDNERADKYRIDVRRATCEATDRCSAAISNTRDSSQAGAVNSSNLSAEVPSSSQKIDSLPEYSMRLEVADLSFRTENMEVGKPRTPTKATNLNHSFDKSRNARKVPRETADRSADVKFKTDIPMDISFEDESPENDSRVSRGSVKCSTSGAGSTHSSVKASSECKIQLMNETENKQKQTSTRLPEAVDSNLLRNEKTGKRIHSYSPSFPTEPVKVIDNFEKSVPKEASETSNGNVGRKVSVSPVNGPDDEKNGNSLDEKASVGNNSNRSATEENGAPIVEANVPIKMTISAYYYMMLTEHGIDLKPKIFNRICDLIDALTKWDVIENPHIIEEGISILKDIIVPIDLHLSRDIYKAHDGEYIVVIHINSISEIVEMNKNCDFDEANRAVFFKVIKRLDKLLL